MQNSSVKNECINKPVASQLLQALNFIGEDRVAALLF